MKQKEYKQKGFKNKFVIAELATLILQIKPHTQTHTRARAHTQNAVTKNSREIISNFP